jgi:hypothetical protein
MVAADTPCPRPAEALERSASLGSCRDHGRSITTSLAGLSLRQPVIDRLP